MRGHIDREDVAAICAFCAEDQDSEYFGPFTMGTGFCGLKRWVNDDGGIDICANLYERDFNNDDIEADLKMIASRFPSLELTLHSGSDWESEVCSATFHVKDGIVTRCPPEVDTIRELSVFSRIHN